VVGACGFSFVGAGTPTSTQVPGDCHTNECDGAGHIASVVDATDVPASTNTCAPGVCNNGTPATADAAQGTACAQDGGVLCDGQGTCTQTFTVVRVGAIGGTAPASGIAAPVFLDTYYPIAGSSPVSSVALPTAVAGANQPLTLSESATSEGGISRSVDGHYLTLAGYATTPGNAASGGTEARVIARVDDTGTVDTSTTLASTAFGGNNVRGATSVDGSAFWVTGTSTGTGNLGGVWYVPFGATAGGTQIEAAPNNSRRVRIFGGQLYGSSASSPFIALFTVGAGLPTTAPTTGTVLPGMIGMPPTGTASPTPNMYDFLLLDLESSVSGLDTLFLADDSDGVERWTFNGTTWTEDTTFTVLTSPCIGLTGWVTSTGVTLIITTQAGSIERIVVPSAGSPAATLLVTAATNTVYRSVTLAPH
jgi:hypothetical protein